MFKPFFIYCFTIVFVKEADAVNINNHCVIIGYVYISTKRAQMKSQKLFTNANRHVARNTRVRYGKEKKWTDERGGFVFEIPCEENITVQSSVIDSVSYKYFDPFQIVGRVTIFPYKVSKRAILKIETQSNQKSPMILEYHLTLQSKVIDSITRVVVPFLRKVISFLGKIVLSCCVHVSSTFPNLSSVASLVTAIVCMMAPAARILILRRRDHQDCSHNVSFGDQNSMSDDAKICQEKEEEDKKKMMDDEPVDFFDDDIGDEQDETDSLFFDETLPPDMSHKTTTVFPHISHTSIAESLLDLRHGRVKYVVLECPITTSS